MCNRKTVRRKVENILTFCKGPNVISIAARSWQIIPEDIGMIVQLPDADAVRLTRYTEWDVQTLNVNNHAYRDCCGNWP